MPSIGNLVMITGKHSCPHSRIDHFLYSVSHAVPQHLKLITNNKAFFIYFKYTLFIKYDQIQLYHPIKPNKWLIVGQHE